MKIVLTFESSNEEDVKLYKYIKQLGYGEYTAGTKAYWKEQMEKETLSKNLFE